jgi:hypothetical protein
MIENPILREKPLPVKAFLDASRKQEYKLGHQQNKSVTHEVWKARRQPDGSYFCLYQTPSGFDSRRTLFDLLCVFSRKK